MENISREKAEELFSLYSDYVFKTVFILTHSQSLADDITQETFIKVFKNYHQYDKSKPIKPWIYKIALNTLRSEKRKQKWLQYRPFMPETTEKESLVEHQVIKKENEKLLQELINTLPKKYREIVILYYFNNFSLKEVSEVLSIPLGTCKSRMYYARKKLNCISKENSQNIRSWKYE